jgi:phage terminase Nu1 subunit (DNA packaging protein)
MSDTPSAAPATVNKADLATILRTSTNTVDRMIRQHGAAFPIVRRGTNGVSYEFDPAAVVAFLADLDATRTAAGQAKDELMQQYQLPDIDPPETAELKPQDRLKLAQLRQIERREAIEAGFLVETAAVRQAFTSAFAALRRDMSSAIRQAFRDANIPEAVTRAVEAKIGEAQRRAVDSASKILEHNGDPEPVLL